MAPEAATQSPDPDAVSGPKRRDVRAWGSVCKEYYVSGHKFKVGQTVTYTAPFGHAAAADYKVMQLLPAEDDELQYRMKSGDERHDRVAKESQLHRAAS